MRQIFLIWLLLLFNWSVQASEPNIQMVHGEIVQTNSSENQISVGSASGTGSLAVRQFQINPRTRLVGFGQVSELRAGQKSDVTFFQDLKGQLIATQVELIQPKEDETSEKKEKNRDPEDFHF